MSEMHVVQYSGGGGSWVAAERVAERFGTENLVLLTADTRSEADDWREFLETSAAHTGGRLVILDQGVDIWDLAFQQHMIPNTRVDFCSRILKREPLRTWLEDNCDPEHTTIHIGFDWTEEHRLVRARPHWEPWTVEAPLMWDPLFDKADISAALAEAGLVLPNAYAAGMPHNNCLRYGCVKGGQAYWKRLRLEYPEAFERSADLEARFRRVHGKDVAILRDRRGGTTKPLTLRALEASETFDEDDWGACSCMAPAVQEAV